MHRKERPRDRQAVPDGTGERTAVAAPPRRPPGTSSGCSGRRATTRSASSCASRSPPRRSKPKTDAEQWEEDWNDAAFAAAQKHFAGPDRPVGTPRERYDVLCPLYKAHGIARPLKYVADNIVWRSFFGHGSPMHRDLATPLATAEAALRKAGVTAAPFRKLWAFNPRTQSGGQWSNHADGKAIDFDEVQNPRLLDKGQRAVISALTEMDISAANPGAGEGLDSYDASAQASERFQDRYSLDGMDERIDEIKEDEADLEAERKELADELAGIPTGKKKGEAKPTADQKALAKKLKGQIDAKQKEINGQVAARKALEKERKRFEGLDQAVADTQKAIDALDVEIGALNAELDKLGKGESLEAGKAALTGKALKTAVTTRKQAVQKRASAIKKQQKKLADATKARDEDPMRGMASRGFLDLDKDMVEALKAAGLGWGGDYAGAKDFMHFEVK